MYRIPCNSIVAVLSLLTMDMAKGCHNRAFATTEVRYYELKL